MSLQKILSDEEINVKIDELKNQLQGQNKNAEIYNSFILPIESQHQGQYAAVCEHGIIKIGTETEVYAEASKKKCKCKEVYITEIPAQL